MVTPPTPSLTVGDSSPSPPPPLTLGESLAHLSRCDKWTMAVFCQIWWLSLPLALVYALKSDILSPSFSSVPWRLALLISWSAYFSLLFMVRSYACLYLPRTPVAVDEKIQNIGMWGVGVFVIGVMVSVVLGLQVRDTRVLAACTAGADAFIVGVVGLWVWLARTYGGDGGDGDALDGV